MAKISDEEWKKIEAALKVKNTGVGAELREFEQSFKKLVALAGANPARMESNCKVENAAKADKYCGDSYKALDRAEVKMRKLKIVTPKTPAEKAFVEFQKETVKLENSLRKAQVDLHDLIPKETFFA